MLNPWPNPSWFDRFLLENPWPAMSILAILALVFAWHSFQHRRRGSWIIAIVFAVLAAAVPLLAHFVTTTRERLIALDKQLVAAVVPHPDLPKLESLFSPTLDFQVPQAPPRSQDRKSLLTLIVRAIAGYRPHDPILLVNDARSSLPGHPPNTAESYFQLRVQLNPSDEGVFSGSPTAVTTDWRIQWHRQPHGSWRIVTLRWLKINGQVPLASMLP